MTAPMPKPSTATRTVISADGTAIAVHESGDIAAPTVVLVHGYPDNHSVWNPVAERLARDFHVVSYDVRGTGSSGKPAPVSAYRMPRLVEDFAAVVDAVSPDAPVHLVGHDWGSVQSWAAVHSDTTVGRIASFSSISGPSLDYAGIWLRDVRAHPRASLRQLAHSYYILLFQLPGLPEAFARRGGIDRGVRRAGGRTEGARPIADQVNGVSLYRANMLGRLGAPAPRRARIPVQVIVPDRDPFVTPALAAGAPARWVDRLTVTSVSGGHWVVLDEPDEIAALLTGFIAGHPASAAPAARPAAPATSSAPADDAKESIR